MVAESDVEIELNTRELSMYLVSNMTQEEIDHEGWTDCCHSRRSKFGARPGITTKWITSDRGENIVSKWIDQRTDE